MPCDREKADEIRGSTPPRQLRERYHEPLVVRSPALASFLLSQHEIEFVANPQEGGDRTGQWLWVSGGVENGSPFEQRHTGKVIELGPKADAGSAFIEQRSGNGLRDGTRFAAHLARVQVLHPVPVEQRRVLHFQSMTDIDGVDINDLTFENLYSCGGQYSFLSEAPAYLAGNEDIRAAKQLLKLGQGLGIRT